MAVQTRACAFLSIYVDLIFCFKTAMSSCPILSVPVTTVQNNWHFHISPIPIYHHRARKYCHDLNMELATFMPAADYDALQEFLGWY